MYICICAAVTDRQIREFSAERSTDSFREVCRDLGVARQCGRCAAAARSIVGTDLDRAGARQMVQN